MVATAQTTKATGTIAQAARQQSRSVKVNSCTSVYTRVGAFSIAREGVSSAGKRALSSIST